MHNFKTHTYHIILFSLFCNFEFFPSGNPNYEPYDDFTLPNGKLAKTESEFGNAYKQGGSCPAVKAFEHHVHQSNPSCARLFGWESSLRYCYKFVNPDNYKMACEHGLAEGVKDTEFAVAVSYVAACNWRGIPIRVPEEFGEYLSLEIAIWQ